MELNDLKINQEYSNQQLSDIFKCSPQGGMRRSHSTNTLVLISNHTGVELYKDKWIDNHLHYTGMGQTGDQVLSGNQNKTLAESKQIDGLVIHLFEVFEKKKYKYSGIVELADNYYIDEEPDITGNIRSVYKFPLRFVGSNSILSIEDIPKKDSIDSKIYSKKNINLEAKRRSNHNKGISQNRVVKTKVYSRDPFIREYVRQLAKGICQLCEEPAPFEKNGVPFLHVHHIEYLSNGGEDTIENSIAICPNCHARIHQLERSEDKDYLIKKVERRNV